MVNRSSAVLDLDGLSVFRAEGCPAVAGKDAVVLCGPDHGHDRGLSQHGDREGELAILIGEGLGIESEPISACPVRSRSLTESQV